MIFCLLLLVALVWSQEECGINACELFLSSLQLSRNADGGEKADVSVFVWFGFVGSAVGVESRVDFSNMIAEIVESISYPKQVVTKSGSHDFKTSSKSVVTPCFDAWHAHPSMHWDFA